MVNNQYYGWLIAIEYTKPFSENDTLLMDIMANAASIILENDKHLILRNSQETVFQELLHSEFTDSSEFFQRVHNNHMFQNESWAIVASSQIHSDDYTILSAIKNHLSLLLPETPITIEDNTLFVLIDMSNISYIKNTLRNFFKSNALIGAISQSYQNILEAKQYATQAKELLKIAQLLQISDPYIEFDKYSYYHAAYTLLKHGNSQYYIPKELIAVQNYDQKYGTEYCKSIRCWLKNRNLAICAQQLSIHRNTMVYRFEKFQEISGIDLSNESNLLRLYLAFLIQDLSALS